MIDKIIRVDYVDAVIVALVILPHASESGAHATQNTSLDYPIRYVVLKIALFEKEIEFLALRRVVHGHSRVQVATTEEEILE